YSAVSYTWVEPAFSQRLWLRSNKSADYNAYLPITQNVKIMLQHLRKAHKARFLWINAICLNQRDDAEKAVQIPLMGEIYSEAHKVHFWLGEE
ncbi:hypothetical protein BU26DRAFT_381118, partial [Trematosphaeria pertusa]